MSAQRSQRVAQPKRPAPGPEPVGQPGSTRRSRVSNGKTLHAVRVKEGVWKRRFQDIHDDLTALLPGQPDVAQQLLIRRATEVSVLMERMEARTVAGEHVDDTKYGKLSDRLIRLLRRLNLIAQRVDESDDDDDDTPRTFEIEAALFESFPEAERELLLAGRIEGVSWPVLMAVYEAATGRTIEPPSAPRHTPPRRRPWDQPWAPEQQPARSQCPMRVSARRGSIIQGRQDPHYRQMVLDRQYGRVPPPPPPPPDPAILHERRRIADLRYVAGRMIFGRPS